MKLGYDINEKARVKLIGQYLEQEDDFAGGLTEALWKQNPKQSIYPQDGSKTDYRYLLGFIYDMDIGETQKLNLKASVSGVKWDTVSSGNRLMGNPDRGIPIVELNYSIAHRLFGRDGRFLFGGEYWRATRDWKMWIPYNGTLRQDREYDIKTSAGYIQEEFKLNDFLTLSAGVRYDYVDYDNYDNLSDEPLKKHLSETSPSGGIVWHLNPALDVFGHYSHGFRHPQSSDLARNPDLDPETLDSWELGIRGKVSNRLVYDVTFYWNDYKNEIIAPSTYERENLGESRCRGIEVSLDADMGYGLHPFISYSYQDTEIREYEAGGISYKGKNLTLVPQHMVRVGLTYDSQMLGRLDFVVDLSDKKYISLDNTRTLDGYAVVSFKWEKQFLGWLTPFVSINNLFDEDYCEYATVSTSGESFYPMPGINFFAGVKYEI